MARAATLTWTMLLAAAVGLVAGDSGREWLREVENVGSGK